MDEQKRIALTDNSFTADDRLYVIHSNVNIERYRVLEELQVRAGYGASYAQLHNGFTKIIKLVNDGKRFESDIALHNLAQGVARKINKQHDPMLLIATLFCCTADEDRTQWNEETANEKIELWSKEGYPVEDFFGLSLRFVRHYQEGLFNDFLDTSDQEEPEADLTEDQKS